MSIKNIFKPRDSNKSVFPSAKNRGVNYNAWTSFARGADYLKGYFEFPGYQAKNDSDAKRVRSFMLLSVAEGILRGGSVANFAECGCYKGHSSFALSKLLERHKFESRFYIFDSFEGLSDPTDNDLLADDGASYREDLRALLAGPSLKFVGDFDSYKDLMSGFEFVDVKKGWIPERFNEVQDSSFSLVHIDVDVYEPTRDSIDFFYKRLVPGGVIYIDDYSRPYWPGCDRAVNEYIEALPADSNYRFFEIPLGGAMLMKIA